MTSESKNETEPWIARNKAKYPYAYDPKDSLGRFFDVSGIPHAVLVDATGRVAWSGSPFELRPATIEAALLGALPIPMWEWSGAAKGVRSALVATQYAKALEAAAKLGADDQGPQIVEAVKAQIQGRVAAMRADADKGNHLDTLEAAKQLSKELAGLPEADEARAQEARLAADKEAQRVITGQRKVRKIRESGPRKRKEVDKAIEDLKGLQDQYAGTHAAKEAGELLDHLVRQRNRGG